MDASSLFRGVSPCWERFFPPLRDRLFLGGGASSAGSTAGGDSSEESTAGMTFLSTLSCTGLRAGRGRGCVLLRSVFNPFRNTGGNGICRCSYYFQNNLGYTFPPGAGFCFAHRRAFFFFFVLAVFCHSYPLGKFFQQLSPLRSPSQHRPPKRINACAFTMSDGKIDCPCDPASAKSQRAPTFQAVAQPVPVHRGGRSGLYQRRYKADAAPFVSLRP